MNSYFTSYNWCNVALKRKIDDKNLSMYFILIYNINKGEWVGLRL